MRTTLPLTLLLSIPLLAACGDDGDAGGTGTASMTDATDGGSGTDTTAGSDSGASMTDSGPGSSSGDDTTAGPGTDSSGSDTTPITDGSDSDPSMSGTDSSDSDSSHSGTDPSDSDPSDSDPSMSGTDPSDSDPSMSGTDPSDSDPSDSDPSMSGTDSSDSDPSDSDSDSDTGHTTGDPCEEMGDNLVDNGSFEIPVVMSPAHWDIYTDAEIPGWHMKWLNGGACDPDDPVTEPVVELQQNLHAIAVDGIQYAELDSDCQGPAHNANTDEETTIRLFQEIDTSVGAKFEIRFWARARPNVPGAQLITATFGSAQLLTDVPAPASWTEYVFVVEIDADITTIAFADTGVPNSLGVFLDHVQVYAIDAQCP